MRPVAVKLLWHTDSTYKGKMTLGCPAVIARPHSQPAVTELYYTSREGSSVSEPQKNLNFAAPGKGWNYFLAQDMCDLFPSTPAPTHTWTHSLCFLPGTEKTLFCHIPSTWSSAPCPAVAAPSTSPAPPLLAASHSGAFCTHSFGPNDPARSLS